MQTRKASPDELNAIFWMGFDAWGEGLSPTEYLASCHASQKYRSSVWYVLIVDNQPVSSLIVYRDRFGLGQGCFGIGSLATTPAMRGQGFGTHLLRGVTGMLLDSPDAVATFLHADIDHHFYERLGYRRIPGGDCMYFSHRRPRYVGEPPTYF
ncbi:GNAT family N-acetyltransferase [Aeromonas sanarellii]|uniref:GNAT family N-acetyltransferase n=1 Tax=Aeromonas sanarellii TaxID=633415 RepID=A0ABS4B8I0_9GAMM|nr:GNAT family N-acetyltransferase [Aeromonas sanarellii]MBP0603806.1 GNAT family N-acetyltransferase [Aeromonas sanarellii]